MDLLKHIEGDRMRPNRIKHVYDNWMRKIGSMKHWPIEVQVAETFTCILCCFQGNIACSIMVYPFCLLLTRLNR